MGIYGLAIAVTIVVLIWVLDLLVQLLVKMSYEGHGKRVVDALSKFSALHSRASFGARICVLAIGIDAVVVGFLPDQTQRFSAWTGAGVTSIMLTMVLGHCVLTMVSVLVARPLIVRCAKDRAHAVYRAFGKTPPTALRQLGRLETAGLTAGALAPGMISVATSVWVVAW